MLFISKVLLILAKHSLPAAQQPAGGNARGVMVEIYAVDRGRSIIPGTEERTFDLASLSSEGAARQSPRDGSVSGVSALGHLKTSAAAPDRILANDRDSRHAP
jgi:hypothetical protein